MFRRSSPTPRTWCDDGIGPISWCCIRLEKYNRSVYCSRVNSIEFKRWLAKQGASFAPAKGSHVKGSHVKVFLNGRRSILPMHASELSTGMVEAIKKQLGLKGK